MFTNFFIRDKSEMRQMKMHIVTFWAPMRNRAPNIRVAISNMLPSYIVNMWLYVTLNCPTVCMQWCEVLDDFLLFIPFFCMHD